MCLPSPVPPFDVGLRVPIHISLLEFAAPTDSFLPTAVKSEYASVLDPLPEKVQIQLIEILEKLRELAEERMKGSTSELTQFAAVDDDHD